MNEVMQSVWVGRRLSIMEKLSIASFLASGHEYHGIQLARLPVVCGSCRPSLGRIRTKANDQSDRETQIGTLSKKDGSFCPLDHDQWDAVLRPMDVSAFGENTYSAHLWNEMWRRAARDKNASYAADCLYERLKDAFLPRRADGLWRDLFFAFRQDPSANLKNLHRHFTSYLREGSRRSLR